MPSAPISIHQLDLTRYYLVPRFPESRHAVAWPKPFKVCLVLIIAVILSLPSRAQASPVRMAVGTVGYDAPGAAVLADANGAAVGRCDANHEAFRDGFEARRESQRLQGEGQRREEKLD